MKSIINDNVLEGFDGGDVIRAVVDALAVISKATGDIALHGMAEIQPGCDQPDSDAHMRVADPSALPYACRVTIRDLYIERSVDPDGAIRITLRPR